MLKQVQHDVKNSELISESHQKLKQLIDIQNVSGKQQTSNTK